jgi:RNA exonuclease 1
MPLTKKYKLFSTSNGEKQTCAFFLSDAGCRNGANCKFLHGASKEKETVCAEISETASMISSESEGEVSIKQREPNPFLTPNAPKNKNKVDTENSKQSKKKRRKAARDDDDDEDDIFANPKGKTPSTSSKKNNNNPSPKSNKKQKIVKEEPDSPQGGNFRSLNLPLASFSTTSNANIKQDGNFRNLVSNLPVASFSINGNTSTKQEIVSSSQQAKLESSSEKESRPLPKSTKTSRKWIKAVQKSREHERYDNAFDFSRYKAQQEKAGIESKWIKAKPFGKWCAANPQVVAIDCEMCETQDLLTGSKNHKALCRISVVNAENPEEVLLDTLVKPEWPVSDYRSRINGIKREHLDNVEFTLRHAQAFMLALCSEETIIVGHAVQNDLSALNMEHQCNADSSFLFHAKDSRSASVSLKDLVFNIFNKPMPETHDSVNDARKALDAVLHWLKHDGKVKDIERSTKDYKKNQLFVHRIPKQCKAQNLTSMFFKHTDIQPTGVEDIEFSGNLGKTHVSFRSLRHANLAFETLEGSAEPEASGRLQKKVYLRNGDYVRIRKMAYENNRNPNSSTPNKKN